MIVPTLTVEGFIVVMQTCKLVGHPFLEVFAYIFLVIHDSKLGKSRWVVVN